MNFPGEIRGALPALGGRLADCFSRGQGARVGEAAVASKRVHTREAHTPEMLRVITDRDAGRVFYSRRCPDQVVHIDLFHQVGEVNHMGVARAVREAVAAYTADFPARAYTADSIDVQTGTGGGRCTGTLEYGNKASLKKAHLNHVHMAALLPPGHEALVLYLVYFCEKEIGRQGFEIRKIESVQHMAAGPEGMGDDLSPYSAYSDTYIREKGGGMGSQGQGGALRSYRHNQELETILKLADEFGSLDDVLDMLQQFDSEGAARPTDAPGLRALQELGLIERRDKGLALTDKGRVIRQHIAFYRKEVETEIRRVLRKIPIRVKPSEKWRGNRPCKARKEHSGPSRVVSPDRREWLGSLAISDTVVAAARRTWLEGSAFGIRPEDIRVYQKPRRAPFDICLVIDASASMAGARIKAAKYLAQHLLLSTHDRVAVVAFQEHDVKVVVPFTRSYSRVLEGLRRIQAYGLTPFAHAIVESLNYLKASNARNPLMLIITDGIPTVPKWSINPLDDALEAAGMIAQRRVSFGCIGLEPNKRYLRQLAQKSGGTLYIVGELERDVLASIAHQERRRASS